MDAKKKVLVFDDDSSIVLILKFIFDEMGWMFYSCINSNDVGPYGGVAATQQIKLQPDLQHIPVIFFSAHSDIRQLAHRAGADTYLPKPFDLKNLAEVIDRLLPASV
jgi:DNA-binding NarL/FixJ family response regulator